jgi:TonB family protein
MELRIKIPFPEDPTRRAFVVAAVCSILLHVLLLGSLIAVNTFGAPVHVKRGETLFVDITPDKPEDKAPLGNPARPAGPEPPPSRKAPEPPAPRPKIAAAPPPKALPPAAKAPAPPPPEPAKQVAKAEPPGAAPKPPEPPAPKVPEPAPAKVAEPQPAARPSEPAQPASPALPAGRPSTQTALARPTTPEPPSIFRHPGGGGGLRGGRGGVEGEPIPLDTPEPKYQDYFNKIREKIKANWIYPREAGDRGIQGELLIEFHIAKDGRLDYLALRRTSGAEILDRFAMNAVRLAQPFPPVPDDVAKEVLAINGMFRYQIVGASLLNQYLR